MTNTEHLLKLIKENPDLPVVPMVDSEIVNDEWCAWWMGSFGYSEVTAYYLGEEHVHMKSDNQEEQEETLADMVGCPHYMTKDERDITDLSDEEWNDLYESLTWVKAIVVYICLPD